MKLNLSIAAGSLKNLNFFSPDNTTTHPMSSKVRQAVFNILGDISDLSVLDAYGGSGAFSFEAISRGAKNALLIENNHVSVSAIKASMSRLNLVNQIKLLPISNEAYLRDYEEEFDIVFLDPPYDNLTSNLPSFIPKIVSGGILILSVPIQSSDAIKNQFFQLELLKQKKYGKVLILIYKK